MIEVGTRVTTNHKVDITELDPTLVMQPGVVYQAVFQGTFPATPGWEDTLYRSLHDELAAHGCKLTYFGVCHANQLIIIQWKLADPADAEYQSTSLIGGVAVSTIVLAVVAVIGLGIGGFSLSKITALFQESPELVGVLAGGAILMLMFLTWGYLLRSTR